LGFGLRFVFGLGFSAKGAGAAKAASLSLSRLKANKPISLLHLLELQSSIQSLHLENLLKGFQLKF
jgi:hypothetical protein